jgi:hypothetical protein
MGDNNLLKKNFLLKIFILTLLSVYSLSSFSQQNPLTQSAYNTTNASQNSNTSQQGFDDPGVVSSVAQALGGTMPFDCSVYTQANQNADSAFVSILVQNASVMNTQPQSAQDILYGLLGVSPQNITAYKAGMNLKTACEANLKSIASGISCPKEIEIYDPLSPVFNKGSKKSTSLNTTKKETKVNYDYWEEFYNSLITQAGNCKKSKLDNTVLALSCFEGNINFLTNQLQKVKGDFDRYLMLKQNQIKLIEAEQKREKENKQKIDADVEKYSIAKAKIEAVLPEFAVRSSQSSGDKDKGPRMTVEREIIKTIESEIRKTNQEYRGKITEHVKTCLEKSTLNEIGLGASSGGTDVEYVTSLSPFKAAIEVFRRDRINYYIEQKRFTRRQAEKAVGAEINSFIGQINKFLGTDFYQALRDAAQTNVNPEALFNTDPSKLLSFKGGVSPVASSLFNQAFSQCAKTAQSIYAPDFTEEWKNKMQDFSSQLTAYQSTISQAIEGAAQIGISVSGCARMEAKTTSELKSYANCLKNSVEALEHEYKNKSYDLKNNGATQKCIGLENCLQTLTQIQKASEQRIENLKSGELTAQDPLCKLITPCKGKEPFIKDANEKIQTGLEQASSALGQHTKILQAQVNQLEGVLNNLGIKKLPDLLQDGDIDVSACKNQDSQSLCKLKTPFEKNILSASGFDLNSYKRYLKEAQSEVQTKKENIDQEVADAKQAVSQKLKSCRDEKAGRDEKKLANYKRDLNSLLEKCQQKTRSKLETYASLLKKAQTLWDNFLNEKCYEVKSKDQDKGMPVKVGDAIGDRITFTQASDLQNVIYDDSKFSEILNVCKQEQTVLLSSYKKVAREIKQIKSQLEAIEGTSEDSSSNNEFFSSSSTLGKLISSMDSICKSNEDLDCDIFDKNKMQEECAKVIDDPQYSGVDVEVKKKIKQTVKKAL